MKRWTQTPLLLRRRWPGPPLCPQQPLWLVMLHCRLRLHCQPLPHQCQCQHLAGGRFQHPGLPQLQSLHLAGLDVGEIGLDVEHPGLPQDQGLPLARLLRQQLCWQLLLPQPQASLLLRAGHLPLPRLSPQLPLLNLQLPLLRL